MTAKRNKDTNKKPTLEHLAKAALASQQYGITQNMVRNPTVSFTTECKESKTAADIELVRPSRVDSIVGMEKCETTHERLIE